MIISVLAFDELGARTAVDLWRLHQDVFIIEQACPYPDLDGRDLEPGTRHVVLREAEDLLGCEDLDEQSVADRRDVLAPRHVARVSGSD